MNLCFSTMIQRKSSKGLLQGQEARKMRKRKSNLPPPAFPPTRSSLERRLDFPRPPQIVSNPRQLYNRRSSKRPIWMLNPPFNAILAHLEARKRSISILHRRRYNNQKPRRGQARSVLMVYPNSTLLVLPAPKCPIPESVQRAFKSFPQSTVNLS